MRYTTFFALDAPRLSRGTYLCSALYEREASGSAQVGGRTPMVSPFPLAPSPGRDRNFSFSALMKKIFIAWFALMAPSAALAQLHDNTWVLGYSKFGNIYYMYGHNILTFTDGSLQIDSNSLMKDMEFPFNNSSFSTSEGELFAFFNGLDIRNRTFVQDMENGGDMHEQIDFFTRYYLSYQDIVQGSIFLPYPGHKDSVILLYMSTRELFNSNNEIDRASMDLTAAVIDMSKNNGLGRVVNRKIPVVHDTLVLGKLQAVKHANGRDWWVIIFRRESNQYYRVLIDPEGIHNLGRAEVELPVIDGSGGSVFSPDGKKYAICTGQWLNIFDFDRCTGLLSNQVQISGVGPSTGVAISPNSRFLYHNRRNTAIQYDLWAADIPASGKVVVESPPGLLMMQLAPDGKIYSSCLCRHFPSLNVIYRPDEEGTACEYLRLGIVLYKYNDSSVPNFPNYRLGPLDGSPCDTLGLNKAPVAWYRYKQALFDDLYVEFTDLSYREPATWSWDFGDGSAGSTERHPVHEFQDEGVYQVCLTVSNQHGTDTHCKTLYLGVSAQDNPVLQAQVQVWPNPFRDRLAVTLSANLRSPLFRLYDMTGRPVREERLAFGVNEIETDPLPAGMYFWQVTAGGEVVKSGKIVKTASP